MRVGAARVYLLPGVLAVVVWHAMPAHAQGGPASSGARAVAPAVKAVAEPGFPDPLPAFPAGSIHTLEQSKAAAAAVLTARKQQEVQFEEQRKACYKKFLAEHCLIGVREQNYKINTRINALELEARAFERSNDADTHAQTHAEREARREAKDLKEQPERQERSAGRKQKQEDKQRQNTDFQAQAGERAERAAIATKREQDRRADLARKAAQDKAEAQERARRGIDEKARVDEALKRAAEREAKQKEKAQAKLEREKKGDAPKQPDLPGPPNPADSKASDPAGH